MDKKLLFALALLLTMTLASCGGDDEESYSPEYVMYYKDILFEVPYTQFGSSKATVKKMVKRQIRSESSSKIVFEGGAFDNFQVYYFENDKLVEAATVVPATSDNSIFVTAMKSSYKEWGTMSFKHSYLYAFVYSIYYYVGMTKVNSGAWIIGYVDHDRVTYTESHHQGTETKTINLNKVMKSLEYVE